MLVITFGIASVGIAGLNLHIFSYVTDIGHSPLVAASFMSTIAITQLGSTLVWGMLADKFDIRKVSCIQFLIQGIGLITAITSRQIHVTYIGFFLYGTGLAGSFVLREVIWANFFGRNSLGTVRGLSMLFSHLFAASGAPFFGFLHDRTGSYDLIVHDFFLCAVYVSVLGAVGKAAAAGVGSCQYSVVRRTVNSKPETPNSKRSYSIPTNNSSAVSCRLVNPCS